MWRIGIGLIIGLVVGGWLGYRESPSAPPTINPVEIPKVNPTIKQEYEKVIVNLPKTVKISKKKSPAPLSSIPTNDEPEIVEIPLPVEVVKYIDTSKEYVKELEKINKELENELIKSNARIAYLESQSTGLVWKIGSFSVGFLAGVGYSAIKR